MIGADDLESFYDPEEFGCRVLIIDGAGSAAEVLGMWGDPTAFGRLQRPSVDKGAAQLRVQPNQKVLQIPNEDVPADWRGVKVLEDDVEFSIVDVVPHGRLRSLLTLVPYGDRAARVKDTKSNGWLPTQPRAG